MDQLVPDVAVGVIAAPQRIFSAVVTVAVSSTLAMCHPTMSRASMGSRILVRRGV
jgi:hypothetical protein